MTKPPTVTVMADSSESPRRFAPIPIETTYSSIRKTPKLGEPSRIGPNPELTPEPSPKELWTAPPSRRKPSPPRRRFAPQLIESSRRTFRLGDSGPAMRSTDKTDITPYTNHIYTFKAKQRRRRDDEAIEDGDDEEERRLPPTRRETEDEGVKEYLLELAAKEADRQMQEDALAAFPNSRAREGGVDHFYFREGSSSEDSGQASPAADAEVRPRARRKSSNLGLTWWHKHMQDHAQKLAAQDHEDKVTEASDEESEEEERGRARRRETSQSLIRSDSDLDRMELPGPPDPMWTTNTPLRHDSSSAEEAEALALSARLARDGAQDIFSGVAAPSSTSGIGPAQHLQPPPSSSLQPQTQANKNKSKNNDQGGAAAAAAAASAAGRSPFAALGLRPDAAQLERLRKFKSPPMLGQELHFRKCPSPKQTKLETDHPFNKKRHEDGCANSSQHEKNRDMSGKGGLWRGYCCRSESSGGDGDVQYLVPADLKPTGLLATPFPPGTPAPLDYAISDEPEPVPLLSPSASTDSFTSSSGVGAAVAAAAARGAAAANGTKSGGATLAPLLPPPQQPPAAGGGLHMLHGLGERLAQEKARAERDEKIAAEFDDAFVTQVFNYLSLGYPSMARGFDEELGKISSVAIDELTSYDAAAAGVKGYLLEASADVTIPDEERCPRWRALKTYIYEWARQHPDLDSFDPLAWGVRERRGSWAI